MKYNNCSTHKFPGHNPYPFFRFNPGIVRWYTGVAVLLLWIFWFFCFKAEECAASDLTIDSEQVQIHGFISQGYLKSDHNNYYADTRKGTFKFNELGINFTSDVTDRLRMGMQFFARQFGDLGKNKVTLDWAFADFYWSSWLGIRAGNLKIPHGLYNKQRDIDILRANIFLPNSVYSEQWRESVTLMEGIGIYGTISIRHMGKFVYQIQEGIGQIDGEGGLVKTFRDFFPVEIDQYEIDPPQIHSASLEWYSLGNKLRIGLSLNNFDLNGKAVMRLSNFPSNLSSHFESDAKAFSVSVEYTLANIILMAEYSEIEYSRLIKLDGLSTTFDLGKEKSVGYYAGLSYRFNEQLQIGSYYSAYFPAKVNRDEGPLFSEPYPLHYDYLKDFELCVRFDINEHWALKIEGHVMNGTASLYRMDNLNPDGSDAAKKYWNLYATKLTFYF